jgi:type IV pilus assembly protein PilX
MALIVSLIFLLLLTMIGISSMQNASLQERMAGSVKLRNESFQVAEAALLQRAITYWPFVQAILPVLLQMQPLSRQLALMAMSCGSQ